MARAASQTVRQIDSLRRPPRRGGVLPRRISRFALEQRSRFDDTRLDDGVRRLMWAILKDGLRDFQNHATAHSVYEQRRFRDADRWIRSRDVRWVFSFETICGVLGIDCDYLRREVRRWWRAHHAHEAEEGVANVSA